MHIRFEFNSLGKSFHRYPRVFLAKYLQCHHNLLKANNLYSLYESDSNKYFTNYSDSNNQQLFHILSELNNHCLFNLLISFEPIWKSHLHMKLIITIKNHFTHFLDLNNHFFYYLHNNLKTKKKKQ